MKNNTPDVNEDENLGQILSANDPVVRGKIIDTTHLQNDENNITDDGVGDQFVSGEMPDTESDDDMLENSHQVGLRLDEDYDNPKELNIAADIAAAEAERHGTSDVDEHDDDY